MNNKLLSGLKVIELSGFVAGPGCARALADWGADVIKVEPIYGDIWRYMGADLGCPAYEYENPIFDVENANKRAIAINLKTEEGQEILHKLLSKSDVMITNYRQKALERLNITYHKISKKYPALIYGYVVGYGEEGPDKDRSSYDISAYLARSGLMSQLVEPGSPPLNIISSFGDHQVSMSLAAGICAALFKKNQTGKGEKVTVSLYHCAIYALASMLVAVDYGKTKYPVSRKKPLDPIVNTYKCKDGRWIVLVCPDYEKQWPILCHAIKRDDLANVEKFQKRQNMVDHIEEIVEILDGEFIKQNIEFWSKRLNKADLPFEKIQSWEEVINDEQAWLNEYFQKVTYDNGKKATIPTIPVKFKEMGTSKFKVAPKLGEDTKEVLSDLGYSSTEIQTMIESEAIKCHKTDK